MVKIQGVFLQNIPNICSMYVKHKDPYSAFDLRWIWIHWNGL